MASVREHGNGWQVRYLSDGRRQCEQFPTREAAEIRSAEIELARAKGLTTEARPHSVKFEVLADAVVTYYEINALRSVDDVEARFRIHLIPVFGRRKAVSITTGNINAYIKTRKDAGAANGTINRELEAMRRAYRMGMDEGAVASMPKIPRLKENNVRTGFFIRAEVDRLCRHLPAPLARFTLFAFLTGWRYDEIRNLKWSNVDFTAGTLRLDPGATKNGEGRVFPITRELLELLEKSQTKNKLQPYVFIIRGAQVGQFRKTWKTACHKAGLPCVVTKEGKVLKSLRLFHDLRRSAVQAFIQAGMPDKLAMTLSGHKTHSTINRYNIISRNQMMDAVRYLESAEGQPKHRAS